MIGQSAAIPAAGQRSTRRIRKVRVGRKRHPVSTGSGGDRRQGYQAAIIGSGYAIIGSGYDRAMPTRRRLLAAAAALPLANAATGRTAADDPPAVGQDAIDQTPVDQALVVRHSVVPWCFRDTHDVPQLAQAARQLGIRSVELCDPKHWPMLKSLGMTCAIAGSHGFRLGPAHRQAWDRCRQSLTQRIDQCREAGVERVISFIGMAEQDGRTVDRATALGNAEAFFAELMPVAEAAGVTVCIEMLNSRDDSHPMKGHPGYLGDDIDEVAALCRRVDSPRLRLLFDIYHVQIMHGDLIRRVREHADLIGHVHTAGNPGRGELSADQEIQYRPVIAALMETGYDGFVGHEFIPTADPLAGLAEAVRVCSLNVVE